jgi:hypothetical protein
MKSFGNLILMTLICLVIFWVFMALRPANAQSTQQEQTGTVLGHGTQEEYGEDRGKRMFECGDVIVDHAHVSDVEVYTIEISQWHRVSNSKTKTQFPVVTFNTKNGALTVNGKRCKNYVPK